MEPGIIFFVGLLGLACSFVRRAAKLEALEQHGVRVVATVTSIETHAKLTRVTASWRHPQTRQVYPCHSWMLFNPLPLQPGSQVQVLVDPANYQHYSMKVARYRPRVSIWHKTHQRATVPVVVQLSNTISHSVPFPPCFNSFS